MAKKNAEDVYAGFDSINVDLLVHLKRILASSFFSAILPVPFL
jgi:hypothetical protein